MNARPEIKTVHSVCPHDCPSACALEVEVLDEHTIGRVYGAKQNTYTAGVVCAKVARYAERVHHPDRLTHALKRKGAKGSGEWQEIAIEDALDEVAEQLLKIESRHGAEAIWPYYYAGTMGLVMRDGINRLRHVKGYSGMYDTFCVSLPWSGYIAGTGKLAGADPREMAKSDLIIIWGTNPVHTQVNVMTHAIRGRKERGAKIVCVDVYETSTMKQADVGVVLKPGTDGALACALMHILFRDGTADRAYMAKYTDDPAGLEAQLKDKTPEWAATITGLKMEQIEDLARMIGETDRTYFRLGYGFARQRNGSANMHAALSIAAVKGCWQHEGGGAFHNNGGIYHWNKTLIEGLDVKDASVRWMDQSQIGRVLTGDKAALKGGGPVMALFTQNTNPVSVAPEQELVKQGFARKDLFTCVHEQFLTETAAWADIVLPATMFLEHDDLYQGGGHQHIMLGPKLIEAPGECRSNHDVLVGLAKRLGAEHDGFSQTPGQLIDHTLQESGWGTVEELEKVHWIDAQPEFEKAHFLKGFGHPDGKYRFSPDWKSAYFRREVTNYGDCEAMPKWPTHWDVTENADAEHPFRMATSPARNFLNSSFNETPTSIEKEGRPELYVHPEDLTDLGLEDGQKVVIGNTRGQVRLHVSAFEGVQRGVVIAESIWPNHAFEDGRGINTLVSADVPAPVGGGTFHDVHVWVRAA
ncbi:MAG: molybdopterin oxidoreductase family protein [Alphaproteobacteria bacterium]|nr:molybdopterin oxidoreductase family protein [Alphaproteobacteria bacterium]